MKASLIEPIGRTAYRLSLSAGRPMLPGRAEAFTTEAGATCYLFEDGSALVVNYGLVNERPWPHFSWDSPDDLLRAVAYARGGTR